MLNCYYLWRKLAFTGNSRGFGGRELCSFWPASTVDRCASGRAGWYSIVDAAMRGCYGQSLYEDDDATLDDLHEAVTTFEDLERIARRVLGNSHPLTSDIEEYLQIAQDVLRAHETPPPPESATTTVAVPDSAPSLADVVSQFGKAVSDGKYRA